MQTCRDSPTFSQQQCLVDLVECLARQATEVGLGHEPDVLKLQALWATSRHDLMGEALIKSVYQRAWKQAWQILDEHGVEELQSLCQMGGAPDAAVSSFVEDATKGLQEAAEDLFLAQEWPPPRQAPQAHKARHSAGLNRMVFETVSLTSERPASEYGYLQSRPGSDLHILASTSSQGEEDLLQPEAHDLQHRASSDLLLESASAAGGLELGWTCLADAVCGSSRVASAVDALQSCADGAGPMQEALHLLAGRNPAVLLEDVLSSQSWPRLCSSIQSLLDRTHGDGGSSCNSDAASTASGRQAAQAVELLIMQLSKECCDTSAHHAVQLWLALCTSMLITLPDSCQHLLLCPDQPTPSLLSNPSLSGFLRLALSSWCLLKALVHDWHFLSPQQHCSPVTSQLHCILQHALQQPRRLTVFHLTLLFDPGASWMQRLCSTAGSMQYMAGNMLQLVPDLIINLMQPSLAHRQLEQGHHPLCVHLLQAVTCAVLSLPDSVWDAQRAQHAPPQATGNQAAVGSSSPAASKQDLLAAFYEHLLSGVASSHLALSCTPGTTQGLLASLALTQLGTWSKSAWDLLVQLVQAGCRQVSSQPGAVWLLNLCAEVMTAQAVSPAGADLLVGADGSSALMAVVYPVLEAMAVGTASVDCCRLVKAVITALGCTHTLLTHASVGAALVQHLLQLLSQSASYDSDGVSQGILDLLLHLVAHVPCVLPHLETAGALPQLAAYLAHNQQYASQHDELTCAANIVALSQSGQEELLGRGWLHHLLLPSAAALSDDWTAMQADQQATPDEQPCAADCTPVRMNSLLSCLSWVEVHACLVSRSHTPYGSRKGYNGHQVLQSLVTWLDISWSEQTTAATPPAAAPHSARITGAPARLALTCLCMWACQPAALAALDATTNIRWYLMRMLACARVCTNSSSLALPHDVDADPPDEPPAHVLACDDSTRDALCLLCNLTKSADAAAPSSAPMDVLVNAQAGSTSQDSAIASAVKAGAGMSDPLGWLHVAQASFQADMKQAQPFDVQSLGLLLQRCVLVAWPGICATAATSQEASWAGACHTSQWPRRNLSLATAVADSAGEPPSPIAVKMVQAVWSSLTQGGTCLPSSPELSQMLSDTHIITEQRAVLSACQASSGTASSSLTLPVELDVARLASWLTRVHAAGFNTAPGDAMCSREPVGDAFAVLVGMLLGQGSSSRPDGAQHAGIELLAGLIKAPAALYLWPRLALHCVGTTTGVATALCTAVVFVLQHSEPSLLAALGGRRGLALTCLLHHVVRWLGFGSSSSEDGGLAWCGVLPGQQVVAGLVQHVICGPDYLVYGCVAMLKQVEEELKAAAQSASLITWLASNPLRDCTWSPVMSYMDELCHLHRSTVLPFMLHELSL